MQCKIANACAQQMTFMCDDDDVDDDDDDDGGDDDRGWRRPRSMIRNAGNVEIRCKILSCFVRIHLRQKRL